eukprot:11092693-Karenia_brevis.AAC.1
MQEILDPQPLMSAVVTRLLAWIEREDEALFAGRQSPQFKTLAGDPIFDDEEWWLTDVQWRKQHQEGAKDNAIEEGPASDDELEQAPDEVVTDEEDDPEDSDTDA